MENNPQINKVFSFIKTLILSIFRVAAIISIGFLKSVLIAFVNSKEKKPDAPTSKEIWTGEKLPFSGKYRNK